MKFFEKSLTQRRIKSEVNNAEGKKEFLPRTTQTTRTCCSAFSKGSSWFLLVRGILFLFIFSFLIIGCQDETGVHEDTGFIPAGVWSDGFGGSYTITAENLEFDDGFGFTEFKGTIEAAIDFSQDSGVLIIKINSSETGITVNSFIGVYYKDYTSAHIFLANAIDESYAVIEVNAINDAKKTFNVDNVGTHVTHWGSGYSQ